jgi:putative ATP-dependent endonuclease of the OLD family
MYLSELLVINYKSCKNFCVQFQGDYPNIFIGINDCGKSTILKAVELLLDVKAKFYFASEDKMKADLSNTKLEENDYRAVFAEKGLPSLPYTQSECVIMGKFKLEELDTYPELVSTLSEHLLWVLDQAENAELWLARVFSANSPKPIDYILTKDTRDTPIQLYRATQKIIEGKKKELNISSEDIENENNRGRYKKIELIKAIYTKYDLSDYWQEYKTDKNFFPEVRYLDWNISFEQLIQFANDTINTKISSIINDAKIFATEQAKNAQEIVDEEFKRFTEEVTAELPNIRTIKANISFQVNSSVTDLLVDKYHSDGDIHLDSQGDGIKRQLWFALIKWSALNSIEENVTNTKFIWCFDEPETHLYPKAQREFFELIKKVSQKNVQSIVSTHSTIFIDRAKLRNINKIDLESGYTLTSYCQDIEDIYSSLQIKNSDFLFYDKFLVIEGDTEFHLIPYLYELHTGSTLINDSVQLINLGGCNKRKQNQEILANVLQGFKKDADSAIVYIFDNDAFKDFTDHELSTLNYVTVGKQDIEDSISSHVWQAFVNDIYQDDCFIALAEIEKIKETIPKYDKGIRNDIQSNQKFYAKLKSYCKQKAHQEDIEYALPDKGIGSGKLLTRFINNIDQIAPEIKEAFDRIKP